MYTSTILTLALAALTTALPTQKRQADDKYYGVSLYAHNTFTSGQEYTSPIPIEINKLTQTTNMSTFKLSFDKGVHINVDINAIECRAYKDAAGVVPGSAPFTVDSPALLSTPGNPVVVNSILCYVTETE